MCPNALKIKGFPENRKTPNNVARCARLCYIHAGFYCPIQRGHERPRAQHTMVCRNSGPERGRVDVSEPASISSGIAERYATAVFEIAKENKTLSKLEGGLDDLSSALGDSADLRDLISSPLYSRDDQAKAIAEIAGKMALQPVLKNALALMAEKRRLYVLPHLIAQLRDMIAEDKGEVTADVVTAKPLTKAQSENLPRLLPRVSARCQINAAVDKSLVGGLVVKVGSKMIDTSIASKLASLQNAMKEVG